MCSASTFLPIINTVVRALLSHWNNFQNVSFSAHSSWKETVDQDADKEKYDFANVRPMYYFDLGRV